MGVSMLDLRNKFPVSSSASRDDGARILAKAVALENVLWKRTAEIDELNRLPDDLVSDLRESGVFRMGFSSDRGGPEMSECEKARVVEALARGNASVAWCVMVGMDTGIYADFLGAGRGVEVLTGIDDITAGSIPPMGRADRVEGGYRVSGSWRFGSGISHADWVVAGCVVHRGGRVEQNVGSVTSRAKWIVVVAERGAFTIDPDLKMSGLKGSGSFSYSTDDLYVPEAHVFSFANPAIKSPNTAVDSILRTMPAVPLGVAEAALNYAIGMAEARIDSIEGCKWKVSSRVQAVIAACEMRLGAARAYVYGVLDAFDRGIGEGGGGGHVSLALSRMNAFREARYIVQTLIDLTGSSAVALSCPLTGWLNDLNVMCQHAAVQEQVVQSAGAVLLGGEPSNRFSVGLPD